MPLLLLVALQAGISAASLVVEIVAGRMLAPYVGMSLYTWTAVIAVVLSGFSVGHWWGGRIAERSGRDALLRTAWWLMAAAATTALAVPLIQAIAGPIAGLVDGYVATITLLSLGVFFLPSLFAGIPAPVLAQIAVRDAGERSGRALGAMFASGAVGAIGGTLAAGFLFIPWLGTTTTLALVTGFYLLSAAVLFLMAGRTSPPVLPVVAALVIAGISVLSLTRLSPCTVESRYFCIRVIDLSGNSERPVRRMVLDHLSHGTSARERPRTMHSQFTAMLDAIARRRMEGRRFSAFFIGGGTYSVPRAWADRKTGPLTIAEIDPDVTRIAAQHFWVDTGSMTVLHEDARRALLSRPTEKYDVMIGDAFGDIAIPSHLVTRQFFALVDSRLDEGGVFLMNVVDYPQSLEALAAIYATLKGVFPSVEIWTRQSAPEPGEQRVFVLVASQNRSAFSTITVPAPEPTRFAAFADDFYEQLVSGGRGMVLTDDHAPIDRLLAAGG